MSRLDMGTRMTPAAAVRVHHGLVFNQGATMAHQDPTAGSTPPTEKERRELWHKLEKVRFTMLTTHDLDGELASRPVTTQQAQEDGVLWFFVPVDGGIAEELGRDPRVMLNYVDLSDNLYVSLRGTGQILKDRAKVRDLWNAMAGAWFTQGPDDPKLALLRVDVDKGEYWEPEVSKVVQFFSIAKAALTRTPPKHVGEHREFQN
jgi:general stress protein 26